MCKSSFIYYIVLLLLLLFYTILSSAQKFEKPIILKLGLNGKIFAGLPKTVRWNKILLNL